MSIEVVAIPGRKNLYLRGTFLGQKIFESAGTGDQTIANALRVRRENDILTESLHGKRAVRTFADAAASYLEFEPRTAATAEYVRKLLIHFRNAALAQVGQDALAGAFRAVLRDGQAAAPATKVRAVITPLNAIMEHAATMGWCGRPAFKKPRVPKTTTHFLLPAEADALIASAAPHIRPLLTFLIGTGCRMSEALELTWDRVDLYGARARVWQKQGNERRVDLPPRVLTALRAIPFEGETREGAVFRPVLSRAVIGQERAKHGKRGKRVGESYRITGYGGGQIKAAWATACRKAGLPGAWHEWTPKGAKRPARRWVPVFTPHDCRHTWASAHYVMNRDLLKLKHDGGWATVAMCEHYAHMQPYIYAQQWRDWLAGGATEMLMEA
jgi:integrase